MKNTCPRCQENKAQIDRVYGVLPCLDCQGDDRKTKKPSFRGFVEFTSNAVKEQRQKYKEDILQPFIGGKLSKEYVNEYGTNKLSVTKQEIKEAQYTNKDTVGWRPNE